MNTIPTQPYTRPLHLADANTWWDELSDEQKLGLWVKYRGSR